MMNSPMKVLHMTIVFALLLWSPQCAANAHNTINSSTTINSASPQMLHESTADDATSNADQYSRLFRREFDPDRFAKDDKWKKYVAKGDHLLCAMRATDKGAGFLIQDNRNPPSAASPWSGGLNDELAKWFWHTAWADPDDCDWKRQKLQGTFDGLKINWRPMYDDDGEPVPNGANTCYRINHYNVDDVEDPDADFPQMKKPIDQKYKVDKTWYSATGGYYIFSVNVRDGAIIGINLESPFSSTTRYDGWGRPVQPDELPALRHCSDIYMGYWVRNNPNVRNLRIYGAHNVVNEDTTLLTGRAFKNKGYVQVKEWPGHSFDTSTDEGKALLASPIGATIANMLIRNKAILGIKHVTRVTVVTEDVLGRQFGSKKKHDFHLFFHIENVPDDEIPQDEPEDKPGHKQVDKLNENLTQKGHSKADNIVSTSETDSTVLRVHQFNI